MLEMQHQDWNVVTLKKKKTRDRNQVSSRGMNNDFLKIDNATTAYRIKTIDRTQSLQIQQHRLKKKMTRKQLARKANIPVDLVTKFEQGSAQKKDIKTLNLLKRILGIK